MKSHEQVVQNIKDLGGCVTSGTFLHAACMLPCRVVLKYVEDDQLAVLTQSTNDKGVTALYEGSYFSASDAGQVADAIREYGHRVKSIIDGTVPSIAWCVERDKMDRLPFVADPE